MGYDGFNATYKALGVDFDKTTTNQTTIGKDVVQKGLDQGVFYKKKMDLYGLIY